MHKLIHTIAILMLCILLTFPLTSRKVEKTKHENFNFVHLSFFFFLVTDNSKTLLCMQTYQAIALLMEIILTCFEIRVS